MKRAKQKNTSRSHLIIDADLEDGYFALKLHGNRESMQMRFFLRGEEEGDENILKLIVMIVVQLTECIKNIELHALNS
jgi:hypothetical protein